MQNSLFPYLVLSGTHKKIGQATGETFRNKIQIILSERKSSIPHYEDVCGHIGPYKKAAQERFPQLVEELQGMAEGAKVSFDDLFFYNTREIYDHTRTTDREFIQTYDHCTVAVSFNANGAIIGHNEDWSITSQENLYILKATIGDTTFLGLEYIGYLPGCSATLNNWGLVQCINELEQTTREGVPKYFLARALSQSKTLDNAVEIAQTTKRASGFNHVLVLEEEVRDIEIAHGDINIHAQIHTPYAHTNHCISGTMKHYENDNAAHRENSFIRYEQVKKLLTMPMEVSDMHRLLSDHTHKEDSICRHGDVSTIASVIIEPAKGEFFVGGGNPCKSELVKYTI